MTYRPRSKAAILAGMREATARQRTADIQRRMDRLTARRAARPVHRPDSGAVHLRNIKAWLETALLGTSDIAAGYERWPRLREA